MADNNTDRRDEFFKERAGTEEARFHVVPHDEEGWAVKKEGQDEPESTFASKDDAVDQATQWAKEAKTMVYVHDGDGQIESQENYQE